MSELFSEFWKERNNNKNNAGKLCFKGVSNHDVYNITAPFNSANKVIIAGRVEPRDQEYSSVIFFEEIDNAWHPIVGAPMFKLQDPFVTFIKNELIFGGVEIWDIDGEKGERELEWKTVFYRGSDIFNLIEFFSGPTGMKDIRLCDLENGKIAVFTRPQGSVGGRGIISYTEVNQLKELTIEVIEDAHPLKNMFHSMDWGGVNEAHRLVNGEIGLLAHVAYFENDDSNQERHYYTSSFIFDPVLRRFRDLKIIACRKQLGAGPAKRKDLSDVMFSGGLIRVDEMAILYAGVSDTEAHWIEIDNPFAT